MPGGIEVILPGIIDSLPGYTFSAFVIRPHRAGQPDVYTGKNVNLHYGSVNNISAAIKLYIWATRNRRSVFHVFNIGPLFLLILRIAGVRSLNYSIHGTRYWENSIQRVILRLFWRLSLSDRYIVTANSEYSKNIFLEKIIPGRGIRVLYNPIDCTRFKPAEGRIRSSSPRKIIYCGRLDREKNLDQWVMTAIYILRKKPDIVFEIYGDGSERRHLQDLIDKYGAGEHILLKGYTDKPEKAMQQADLMMFLSDYESFGNVVVESILCGTPVIAGAIPAMKEIFSEFPEFLISINENMDEEMLLRLEDTGHLNSLALEAREKFIVRFSPDAHYKALCELYKESAKP